MIEPCGRVRHPDPVRRVAGRHPRRHAEEVVDVQIEEVRAVEVLEDGLVRLRRDPVQPADLVVWPPGALRDLDAVTVQDRLEHVLTHVGSLSTPGCLGLLDQGAVQLGPAVAEEVELVLAGDHVVLVPAPSRRRPRRRAASPRSRRPRRGGCRTGRRSGCEPQNSPLPLLAHPVRGQQVDAVLGGPGERDHLGLHLRRDGEVGRVRDQVGAVQRERPRHLREAEVVADLQADPAERRLPDVELVAGGDEAVDAEERQVRLPVGADQAVGPDEHGRVAQPVAVALEQSADGVHVEAGALAFERFDRTGRARPRRTPSPPRGCRTCSPGSRTPAGRAARRRRRRPPPAAPGTSRGSARARRAPDRAAQPRLAPRDESNSLTFG